MATGAIPAALVGPIGDWKEALAWEAGNLLAEEGAGLVGVAAEGTAAILERSIVAVLEAGLPGDLAAVFDGGPEEVSLRRCSSSGGTSGLTTATGLAFRAAPPELGLADFLNSPPPSLTEEGT